MGSDGGGLFRALVPAGSFRLIFSIICSVIALVSACALAILVFGQELDGDFLSKIILVVFFIGVFLVVHPNFRLTRGAKWPLTYMSVLLLLCILLTLATLVWSYVHDIRDIYVGGLVGLIAGVVGLWGYRSKSVEKLRAHFAQIWQDEYRRREYLRNGK
ncbi:hypothetical protein [Marinobacter zhanjiangensis]|uniref:hypothetical protein n=1 Tax=Marinobacter zhanjiangensis TaxID=578215 RepID=UPI00167C0A77|nr:hypothetical protein [Marinobacter zhanjiangensis]